MSQTPHASAAPAIELIGVDKRFGAVRANRDIHLSVAQGEIHGIVGENGAGKSTLMSILYGFYQADAGEIRVDGRPVAIPDSQAAIALGIGMVHQHFMLVEPFTVLENVMLGAEGGALLAKGRADARAELERLARDYAMQVDPDAVVGELPVGLQQRVEILKALFRGAKTLILDEPTGVLTPEEADHLFRILGRLRDEGKTVILITHKLREIMAATDAVSVMRRGEIVATVRTAETSVEALAEAMVGRRVLLRVEKGPARPGPARLTVENARVVDALGVERLRGVSLTVRAGEIVGIAGVSGNGQSELLEAIAGIRPLTSGAIRIGPEMAPPSPALVRDMKLAHVPEDRHRMGLVTRFEARENAVLGYLKGFTRGVFLDRAAIRERCMRDMADFDVRPPDPSLRTANFSGGNQQKIVLAREIAVDPDVLIVGQPTRGVDVGAIEAIHRRLIELRDAGKAILLVSVELEEVRALSDRVLVMFDGRVMGEAGADATEAEIGLMMAGVERGAAA
ncbi:ABC transporter ATP-binding protein [Rubrimonas cliftonensis]|uniref:Nucleoside ABC transporter ATP-binding protein n=1 Tax=Rubrimonas cliftonensis TaxID=89524 RepID=A0A1H4ALF9_9RHOB|nr:ABC transporter ATP-binding protein [Rubrimonas cliftonensis]SEA36611.1 nucleoside ABC transporter ATP-binding protein [Rubrimonas cliftonensis]